MTRSLRHAARAWATLSNALLSLSLFVLGISTTLTVSDREAYGFYMPDGYAIKEATCTVTLWNSAAYEFVVRDAFLACALSRITQEPPRAAWKSLQWDEKHVRLLSKAP